jgi:hypothetical protein
MSKLDLDLDCLATVWSVELVRRCPAIGDWMTAPMDCFDISILPWPSSSKRIKLTIRLRPVIEKRRPQMTGRRDKDKVAREHIKVQLDSLLRHSEFDLTIPASFLPNLTQKSSGRIIISFGSADDFVPSHFSVSVAVPAFGGCELLGETRQIYGVCGGEWPASTSDGEMERRRALDHSGKE